MYQQILVPTDGSDGARIAAEHAIELAEQFDASIHAIYALDPGTLAPEASSDIVLETLQDTGESALETIAEDADAAGIPIETEMLNGSPHRVILDYADENDIDLIVMGTHGRTGLDRFLLGSVTERVVRSADIPVLTVRQPAP